jgi:hypothetical protein
LPYIRGFTVYLFFSSTTFATCSHRLPLAHVPCSCPLFSLCSVLLAGPTWKKLRLRLLGCPTPPRRQSVGGVQMLLVSLRLRPRPPREMILFQLGLLCVLAPFFPRHQRGHQPHLLLGLQHMLCGCGPLTWSCLTPMARTIRLRPVVMPNHLPRFLPAPPTAAVLPTSGCDLLGLTLLVPRRRSLRLPTLR